MKPRRNLKATLVLGLTTVGLLGLAPGSSQAASAPADGSAPVVNLKVNVSAQRFIAHGSKVTAEGPVVATATRSNGVTTVTHKRVRFKVNATGTCRILELKLARLYLNLLGLKVRTSPINLEITGDSSLVLGSLFCSLSKGLNLNNPAVVKRSVRSINRRLDGRQLQLFAFDAPLRARGGAQASQIIPVGEGECEVLNLILGPLHLELLGLVVDLYGASKEDPVQVLVTGDPNGGLLGSVLCSLTGAPAAAA